jgi:Ni/Fe-hydrogenase subunit HybB-like protein
MWWMGVFYGLYLVVLVVEVWTLFTNHPKIHQYACASAAVIAVCAPFTLGAVFGVMGSKVFWEGIFTPITMVASAFLAGTSLLAIVFYFVHRLRLADFERAAPIALPSIRLLMAVGLAIVGALLVRLVATGLGSDSRALHEATAALVTGPLAPAFWLRVIAGLVAPAVLIAMPIARRPETMLAAGVLGLSGILVDRYLFVAAGQVVPQTAGAGTLSYPFAAYTPSIIEIAIFVGAAALMAFLYTLAERYLNMGESDIHTFFAWPWLKKHLHHADELVESEDGASDEVAAAVRVARGAEG